MCEFDRAQSPCLKDILALFTMLLIDNENKMCAYRFEKTGHWVPLMRQLINEHSELEHHIACYMCLALTNNFATAQFGAKVIVVISETKSFLVNDMDFRSISSSDDTLHSPCIIFLIL